MPIARGEARQLWPGVRCTPIGVQGFRFGRKGSTCTAVRWNATRPTLGEEPLRWRTRRCKVGIIALAIAFSSAMVLASTPNLGSELGFAPPQNEGDISGFEWRDAPPLLLARSSPAVVVLPSGDIVVIGGMASEGPTATTEILDHATSTWRFGPTLNSRRVGHTATLLQDGTVLVVGGDTGSGATSSAEILDLGKAASAPLPRMSFARSGHSAILLKNGNVLVTGGTDWITGIWNQAEVFNVQTHSWMPAGSMSSQRLFFSLQLLQDGSVLAIGGDTNQTSERYDPATNSWSEVAKMNSPRSYSSSAVANGKIIVAGGIADNSLLSSSEMFDPASNSWKAAGSMQVARARFSLTPLPNGDLLAAGSQGPAGTSPSCEVFDPATSTWQDSPQMNVSRGAQGYAVTSDGTTFVIGGKSGGTVTSSVEIFGRKSIKPPTKPLVPIDLVPLVQVAKELPGNSGHGLIAKLEAAQAQYDGGDYDTCINIMTAFYNQVRAFASNGHMEHSHAKAIYDGYVLVIDGMGGEPLPPFTYSSVAKFGDLFIVRG
jgi:hypothetical protein